jgi:uncharacterized damage-inducible protein DinB
LYRHIADFRKDWAQESANTLKILRVLTDKSLAQAVRPGGRTLGRMAWHIALTLGEMSGHAGLKVDAPAESAPTPTSAAVIAAIYEKAARSLDATVGEAWSDQTLDAEIEMYGEKWTRGSTLAALIRHEVHHRAQMTVLMRQAGLKVPGLYGPSREEWGELGMPAAE